MSNNKLIIWLHGYGANGDDLKNIPLGLKYNILSPNAPFVCEEFNSGFQWFSLKDRSFEAIRNGLNQARPFINKYIIEECKKLNCKLSDCFILGFSQGAMIALDLVFLLKEIGGIIAFSGGFFASKEEPILNKKSKILIVHGTHDDVVPYSYMQTASKKLVSLGFNPKTFTCNNAGHTITQDAINYVSEFIKN